MVIKIPFTPFHLGPVLLIGLLLFPSLDLPTLIASSVIVDLEPLAILLLQLNHPPHGPLHSYLGGMILAIVAAIAMSTIRGHAERVMSIFNLRQRSSFKKTLTTSLLGVYLHILLDSFLYQDIKPFYPLEFNPFLNIASPHAQYIVIYGFCALSFLLGLTIYAYRGRGSS